MNAFQLIRDERERQVKEEKFYTSHDDEYTDGELAQAASVYAMPPPRDRHFITDHWPWDIYSWKPTPDNRIQELVKAAALIVAEIQRLQRLEKK